MRTVARGAINRGSFSKGVVPWNQGMKGYRAGHRHSAETRKKIGLALRGEKAGQWRGGVSAPNELARKSTRYKEWRRAVFARDNYTCRLCGARASAGRRLELNADHILPFATHPEARFRLANGRTLCLPCHRRTPTYGASKKKARKLEGDDHARPEAEGDAGGESEAGA